MVKCEGRQVCSLEVSSIGAVERVRCELSYLSCGCIAAKWARFTGALGYYCGEQSLQSAGECEHEHERCGGPLMDPDSGKESVHRGAPKVDTFHLAHSARNSVSRSSGHRQSASPCKW